MPSEFALELGPSRIQEADIRAARQFKPSIPRYCGAGICLINVSDRGIVYVILYYVSGAICRAVIDYNYLYWLIALVQHWFNCLTNMIQPIMYRQLLRTAALLGLCRLC